MEALQFFPEHNKNTLQSRLLLPQLPLQFDSPLSNERDQAKIDEFMPYLLSVKSGNKLVAAIAFQAAIHKNAYS